MTFSSERSSDEFALPRERGVELGFDTLADAELVAVLLGTGQKGRPVNHVAAELLDRCGGVTGLFRTGARALAESSGVGLAKAARIAAGFELGRRLALSSLGPRPTFPSSEEVARWGRIHLSALEHEQVWVLSLDGKNGLRGARRVAEGGLHGCSLQPRDVLRAVVRDAASAFVLLHNHPSGDPKPSPEDIELTAAVARAAMVIGTPLVDHVIVGGTEHASLFDLGILVHS
jgi:DNA repair protein RadC